MRVKVIAGGQGMFDSTTVKDACESQGETDQVEYEETT